MLKKCMLLLALAVIFCVTTNTAVMAQQPSTMEEVETAFAKEKPLTQTDIDTFIKIGPQMVQLSQTNDIVAAEKIIREAGWSEIRGSYITAKISNAYAMNADPEFAQMIMEAAGMPQILLPTDAELKLVADNMDKLEAIFMQVQ